MLTAGLAVVACGLFYGGVMLTCRAYHAVAVREDWDAALFAAVGACGLYLAALMVLPIMVGAMLARGL